MPSLKPIVVYGAGGLARETAWLIHRINQVSPTWDFRGYVVTDSTKLGPHDAVDDVLGDEDWLFNQTGLSVAIGIGSPGARVAIGARLLDNLSTDLLPALVDPSAIFDERTCVFEPGAVITAGNILTVNIKVEAFAFINLSCTVGHESIIGHGSLVNPTVNISGGVELGKGCLIGTGAQILQYIRVGAEGIVGAGACVTKNVAAGSTVVGIPARPR